MLICDMDRAYGGAAGRELVERLTELRRAGTPGTERVIGVGMDSTEIGVDPTDYADAYGLAARAGLRRTAHQGEDTPPAGDRRPASTCSASSASTTACPCWTIRS